MDEMGEQTFIVLSIRPSICICFPDSWFDHAESEDSLCLFHQSATPCTSLMYQTLLLCVCIISMCANIRTYNHISVFLDRNQQNAVPVKHAACEERAGVLRAFTHGSPPPLHLHFHDNGIPSESPTPEEHADTRPLCVKQPSADGRQRCHGYGSRTPKPH